MTILPVKAVNIFMSCFFYLFSIGKEAFSFRAYFWYHRYKKINVVSQFNSFIYKYFIHESLR